MAERNTLDWNLPNWITVFLMATIGYAIIVCGIGVYQKTVGGN